MSKKSKQIFKTMSHTKTIKMIQKKIYEKFSDSDSGTNKPV